MKATESDIIRPALLQLVRIGLGFDASFPFDIQDWHSLFEMAAKQGVLTICFDGYRRLYDSGHILNMPLDIKKQWIAASYNDEVFFSKQLKAASEMAQFFYVNGIRTYVLKGIVFSECYPIAAHRRSSDLDCFLTSERDHKCTFETGNLLIEGKGIRVNSTYYKNSSYDLPGLHVENHKFITPFRCNKYLTEMERVLQQMIFEDDGKDRIGDSFLCRPPVLFSALFLVEHAYSHFIPDGLMLRHIIDWAMFYRRNAEYLDYNAFERYLDVFGLRRFFDAFDGLSKYLIGEITNHDLSESMDRVLESIWNGLPTSNDHRGLCAKLGMVRNNFKSAWKYRMFSPYSMPYAIWIKIKGFLFMKEPKIDSYV